MLDDINGRKCYTGVTQMVIENTVYVEIYDGIDFLQNNLLVKIREDIVIPGEIVYTEDNYCIIKFKTNDDSVVPLSYILIY